MEPGAVLALNHQHREKDGLPEEGFLRSLGRHAEGWRVLSGRTPKGAQIRKDIRAGDTLHITVYAFASAPVSFKDVANQPVGVRSAKIEHRGSVCHLCRGVYLLVPQVHVTPLEKMIKDHGTFALKVLEAVPAILAAAHVARRWMEE